jgi:hypothetical protein
VTVRFESDFDPIAGITMLAIDTATGRSSYTSDDDSGENLAPELRFTTAQAGTLTLCVGGWRSTAGCYRYKVEVQ